MFKGLNDKVTLNENFYNIKTDHETIVLGELEKCKFTNCLLKNCHFDRTSFVACDFTNTAFLNVEFYECSFIKCKFKQTKMQGVTFINNHFKQVNFDETKNLFVSFSNCKWRQISSLNTTWQDTLLENVDLKKVIFSNNNLLKTEWYLTSLKDVDLSTCLISDIKISLKDLEGVILDSSQLYILAPLLKIKLKDVSYEDDCCT